MRARSDIKLMNQVVNFLSLLSATEEQGGVKRMLGVCTEFERIAKVVLEKNDKESKSRKRKGKPSTPRETPPPPFLQQEGLSTPQQRPQPPTPSQVQPLTPAQASTFSFAGEMGTPVNPAATGLTPGSLTDGNLAIPMDFGDGDFSGLTPSGGFNLEQLQEGASLSPGPGFGGLNPGTFRESFLPQDLWQMPTTLEWDWADTVTGLPGGPPFDGQTQRSDGS